MKNLSRFDLGMIIAFAVVTLLGGGAAFYTFSLQGAAHDNLVQVQEDLDALTAKQPYNPSQTSITILSKNIETLKNGVTPVIKANLQSDSNPITQIQNQSPVSWKTDLDDRVKALHSLADKNQVGLPDRYYFGFSRYLSNNPNNDTTGELSKQLAYIEQIATSVINNHAVSLDRILRTYDEDEEDAFGSYTRTDPDILPGRMVKSPDGFYLSHPFQVEFTCDTVCLRAVINQLAASPFVFLIRSVTVVNSASDVPTKTSIAAMAASSAPPAPSASTSPLDALTAPNPPGEANPTPTPPPPPTSGPKYLFGSETLKVTLRVDGIEWVGLSDQTAPRVKPGPTLPTND